MKNGDYYLKYKIYWKCLAYRLHFRSNQVGMLIKLILFLATFLISYNSSHH